MSELFPDPELYKLATRRPENELLLLCTRRGGDAEAASRLRELARVEIDWDYLYRLARRHAVLPLMYRGLEESMPDAAPAETRERLRGKFREQATRNTLLAGELVRVARLFGAAGVGSLAYKGPALAVQAYGDLALRRFIDLDILVRRGDVARAGEQLLSLGYSKPEGLNASQERFLLRRQHNLAFSRDGGKLTVELHWEVSPASFASVPLGDGAWERAPTLTLHGAEVKCLAPEDLLLALAVHGTKHLWERLAWVCDVAALIDSHPGLDWDFVLGRARASRVERMFRLALRLARGLYGTRLPDGVRAETHDPAVTALASEVTSALFAGAEYEPAGFARNVSFNMRARGRLRERAAYLRHIFTPTDGDLTAVRLPAGMAFLYYFLRPVRLALKGGDPH
ncbi:MAG: nucleotidyltransferase family protein [Acidobacteria bacterium]|nr:nucleotidyltransferase family protein [Acidobacteriota bacterium]